MLQRGMDQNAAFEAIERLWSEESLQAMLCCRCKEPISSDGAFARTIAVAEKSTESYTEPFMAGLDGIVLLYRHLHCLYESTTYVAISHVWSADVADLQYKKQQSASCVTSAFDILRRLPYKIFDALAREMLEPFEIWHDYYSVPQWAGQAKRGILLHIPALYRRARLTVALLSDVDAQSFVDMRAGSTAIQRCRGMGRICSAAWFGRVWTAMELANSPYVMFMVRDFRLMALDADDPPLTHEIWRRWRNEVRAAGSAKDLEATVKALDKSLVPWQLGAVIPVRLNNLNNERTCFGLVYSVLSRRRLTIERDFLYAIEGLLKTGIELRDQKTTKQAMLELAMGCLTAGDLSPLFMVPSSALSGLEDMDLGFADHATWGLGVEQCRPTFPEVRRLQQSYTVALHAEKVGSLQSAAASDWSSMDQISGFHELCKIVLDVCGPDVDAFVTTIGARLYGQLPELLDKRLDCDGRRGNLVACLEQLRNSLGRWQKPQEGIADRIADLLGLSNTSLGDTHEDPQTPMTFVQHHGSTVHHADRAAIVYLMCDRCRAVHLIRMALFAPIYSLVGCKAFRFPGLKYRFSHLGGVGILLKEDRMVGRFLWGHPTCKCPKLVEIKVVVDDLPTPAPESSRPSI
jgi:hypothetical protein